MIKVVGAAAAGFAVSDEAGALEEDIAGALEETASGLLLDGLEEELCREEAGALEEDSGRDETRRESSEEGVWELGASCVRFARLSKVAQDAVPTANRQAANAM